MKIAFFLFLLICINLRAQTQIPRKVNIQDVVTIVSSSNFKVYENALKVYQAQLNIQKARADLLPKLNLWSLVGMIMDPFSVVEKIPEAAPFLVPGNWFRLEETKLLYLAEREGYRALWGNEVFIAKSMYRNMMLDRQLLSHVQLSIQELSKIHKIIKTRELFGGVQPGTARDIEIKLIGLQEDEKNLKILISQQYDELTFSFGWPADTEVEFQTVELPQVESLRPINAKDYEFRLLSQSPERRQYDHFLSVLSQIKNEIKYSFLGLSEISRGVAGGIFDSISIPNGAGLSTVYALKIVDTQKEIMKTQKIGIQETLLRQLKQTGVQYNSDLESIYNFKRRVQLSKDSKTAMYRRVQLGENINVIELSEATKNLIQAEAAVYALQYRVLTTTDRLQRLIFDGDYSMTPALIDSLRNGVRP